MNGHLLGYRKDSKQALSVWEAKVRVHFSVLKSKHYSSDRMSSTYKSGDDVYKEIGYTLESLVKQNPAYENTCAVRMSLALIKNGVNVAGRLKIKDGPHKGKMIEPGAKLLADQLARPAVFGRPDVFAPRDAISRLSGKKGVVLFWKITGYGGGHIDLIEAATAVQTCNSQCYCRPFGGDMSTKRQQNLSPHRHAVGGSL